jgi:hypothetical protein
VNLDEINALIEEAKCYGCIGASQSDLITMALLSRIANSMPAIGQRIPYALLSNSTSINTPVAGVNDEIPWTDIEDVYRLGITVNDTKINIVDAGTYLFAISAVVDSQVPQGVSFNLWLAVDGNDVERSNTIVRFQSISTESTLAVTFLYTFIAGQYMELRYQITNPQGRFVATAAQAGPPPIPACPSIIMTVNKISG